MLSPQFLDIYSKTVQRGTEVTLEKLISVLEIADGHVLDQIQCVRDTLNLYKLELVPDFTEGDLGTTRVLRAKGRPEINPEYVISEIRCGETTSQEFKSSLIYDHKRALAEPTVHIAKLKSDEVAFSCLRTIAAFLTSNGGVLYVGVNNVGECIGIESDFLLLKQGHGTRDDWELHLRSLVSSRFKEGATVNNYVETDFVEVERKTIARLIVQRRKKLSFVKKNNGFALYCRQGNRTIEVRIDEIQELLELRQAETG